MENEETLILKQATDIADKYLAEALNTLGARDMQNILTRVVLEGHAAGLRFAREVHGEVVREFA